MAQAILALTTVTQVPTIQGNNEADPTDPSPSYSDPIQSQLYFRSLSAAFRKMTFFRI
jgi:hypothetical protein